MSSEDGSALIPNIKRRLGKMRPSRLELVSLHVPKTAGTSFRTALETEYGDDLCPVYNKAEPDASRFRAVHGHFNAAQFREQGRRAQWVMWLRDPVNRIASYYDFWSQTEAHGNPNHDHFIASDMSLAEFAEWTPIRNEFTNTYVNGLEPDDLDFVGITERYDTDLPDLAARLGWQTAGEVIRTNVTPKRPTIIDDDTRSRIEAAHAVEVDWYRHFV